jgi:deoxyribodipyrimidine photolyase
MRNSLRSSGNPALCTAVHASRMLSLPVVVLITVEDGGAHDTARRHTFLLQGVQDVSTSLTNLGFATAIYVQSEEGRVPWQFTLAFRAAVVITDEAFCDPWLSSCNELKSKPFPAPLYAVDAACVVPCVTVAASACSRAGSYERATAHARQLALSSPYVDASYQPDSLPPPPVLFKSTPLTDIALLVSRCKVDHEVKPCGHSIGGTGPGYERWSAWVGRGGLNKYAATRNDVLRSGGVSRMSPYLNFGMVSPFRIALEGASSPKFINEMQIWRELSYAWVFHHPDTYCSVSGLPAWAQKALASRPPPRQVLSLQQLTICASGNALWDAMQRSLILAGELHNNARMTWGKALLDWSLNGGDALAKLIYLNDHYALDGLAPPSYGGLMWCLGLFSGGPKIGSRPLGIQAARLDAAKLEQRTADLSRLKSLV